jgi:hypothetical protein
MFLPSFTIFIGTKGGSMNTSIVVFEMFEMLHDSEGIVCHVSSIANHASILAWGVSPAFSQGKLRVCYVCVPLMVYQLAQHVARVHVWSLDDLEVWACPFAPYIKRTAAKGVYSSKFVLPVVACAKFQLPLPL